jgi:hypothetical protein
VDPAKQRQIELLKQDRTKVIGQLRRQFLAGDTKNVMLALIGLQESQDLIEQWEAIDEQQTDSKNAEQQTV